MMTAILTKTALAIGASIELSILFKATIVSVLALAGVVCARGARASARHLLLASLFGVLLALPFVAAGLPAIVVEIPIAVGSDVPNPTTVVRPFSREWASAAVPSRDNQPIPAQQFSISTSTLVRAAWGMGTVVFLLPVAIALLRLRRMRRTALPWMDAPAFIGVLAAEAGVRRRIELSLHENVPGPLTCGIFRPAILFPMDVHTWSDVHLRQAVVHELEHVRRADWAVYIVSRIVCAAYWFHPLVWIAERRLCLESERACDDAVLRGAERDAYAEQLVMLARRLSGGSPQPVLSMANRSDLSARVAAVLDRDQRRGRAGARLAVGIAAIAGALAIGISPLRAVATSQLNRLDASTGTLRFEVASIKPNKVGDNRVMIQASPGGQFTASGVTLRQLIRDAYRLQDIQIVGAPAWTDADRFDIAATIDGRVDDAFEAEQRQVPSRLQRMVRSLLVERFKLALHVETREEPVFALITVRTDGRFGPQLRPAAVDCAAFAANAAAALQRGERPPPPPPSDPGHPRCGTLVGPGVLIGGGMTMAQLAARFSALANTGMPMSRLVLDRTGLQGRFDVDLHFTPDPLPNLAPGRALGLPPIDPNGPSLFTAVQEQLGLKLDAQRAAVDVLVVDHVEPPTED